jgi:hypothetical protein
MLQTLKAKVGTVDDDDELTQRFDKDLSSDDDNGSRLMPALI